MLQGVITSLIAALIFALITWLFRKRILIRFRGAFIGARDIVAFFNNSNEAFFDIKKESLNSKNICYVGAYNTTFLKEKTLKENLLYKILKKSLYEDEKDLPCIRFVHLHPISKFVSIRSEELGYPTTEEIREGIRKCWSDVQLIEDMLNIKGVVKVRYADSQLVFRLILLDSCAYVAHYRAGSMGKKTKVLKVRKNSEVYKWFDRYFNVLWDHGTIDSIDSLSESQKGFEKIR